MFNRSFSAPPAGGTVGSDNWILSGRGLGGGHPVGEPPLILALGGRSSMVSCRRRPDTLGGAVDLWLRWFEVLREGR